MTSFSERFDAYFNAQRDYNSYLEAKGYRAEGDRTLWEPTYEIDIAPDANYGPGAMAVGEMDDYYANNDEPWLAYEEMEEPEEF